MGYTPNPAIGSPGNFAPHCSLDVEVMIIGLGFDIIEISRVAESISRHGDRFLNRIFTAAEQEYCSTRRYPEEHLAARFAAKEACAKALGVGIANGINWLDLEVIRGSSGQPAMALRGYAGELASSMAVERILITLSHAKGNAAAVVVLESETGKS